MTTPSSSVSGWVRNVVGRVSLQIQMINRIFSDIFQELSEFCLGSSSFSKNITKLGTVLFLSCSSSEKLMLGAVTYIIYTATMFVGFLSIGYSLYSKPHAKPDHGVTEKDMGSRKDDKVYTDYSVIRAGIPGDGKCLFRSIAHGLCLAKGEPAPDDEESRADALRIEIVQKLVERRKELEKWSLIEGDFDEHISEMRKPQTWGGSAELYMAPHVIKWPIRVFLPNEGGDGVRLLLEHGQEEYGNHNPINLLYHSSHYDLLLIPDEQKINTLKRV